MSGRGSSGFSSGVALGGLIGAGLALLFAPRSGEETRRKLADWRAANRAERDNDDPAAELLDLGATLLETSLTRLEQARAASREAVVEARLQLTEDWERRKRGS